MTPKRTDFTAENYSLEILRGCLDYTAWMQRIEPHRSRIWAKEITRLNGEIALATK